MKVKLTQKVVDRDLLCPEGKKQIEFCDTELPGLYILVSSISPGIGTYYLRYKNEAGKTCHKKIGRTPDINLKDARIRARQFKLEISQGGDPQAQAKQKRSEMTYSEFFEQHYMPSIESRLRNARGYEIQYRKYLKDAFGDIKVSHISKQMVQIFHTELRNSKGLSNATANRYLQLLKASINFGINMEIIDLKRNPCQGIKLYDEVNNTRYFSSDELARLIPVLIKDDSQPARLIRFLLATGLRRSEAFHTQWKDIDLNERILVVPSTRSKSKKTDSIPLNDAAVQVLQKCDRNTPYPFVNLNTRLPYTTIDKSFKKYLKQAKITEKITLHGLRHTAASLMANNGRSLYEIQSLLRHSSPNVTTRYAHLNRQTILEASDAISQQLLKAAGNQ